MPTLEQLQPVGQLPRDGAPESVAPVESSAQLSPRQRVEDALARTRDADGREERSLAAALNAALRELPRAERPEDAAELLLELLSSKRLEGLAAADGASCRATAVEVLLSLGYPHALSVAPEDLAHLRLQQAGVRVLTKALLAATLYLSTITPILFLPHLREPDALSLRLPFAVGLGFLTAVVAGLLLKQPPASRRALWLRRMLWAAGAVGLTLGVLYTGSFATAPGALAAVAASLAALPARAPEEDPSSVR